MVINKVSLGTGSIDVSSNDKFGLTLEGNINYSKKIVAAVAGRMETMHRIMRVGTYVSIKSLAINHEMLQDMRVMHPSVSKNTVERTTQRVIRILCPNPLLMRHFHKQ